MITISTRKETGMGSGGDQKEKSVKCEHLQRPQNDRQGSTACSKIVETVAQGYLFAQTGEIEPLCS
jgi:hypothetical protein